MSFRFRNAASTWSGNVRSAAVSPELEPVIVSSHLLLWCISPLPELLGRLSHRRVDIRLHRVLPPGQHEQVPLAGSGCPDNDPIHRAPATCVHLEEVIADPLTMLRPPAQHHLQ